MFKRPVMEDLKRRSNVDMTGCNEGRFGERAS
jgi:hypothetical protein